MKRCSILTGLAAGISFILCVQQGALAQKIKRTGPVSKYNFAFRPTPLSGRGMRVKVIVRGLDVRPHFNVDRIRAVRITVESAGPDERKVLSRILVEGPFFGRFRASLFRHRKSKDLLLAIEENRGQWDHTEVYYISSRVLKAHLITDDLDDLGCFQGDPSRLTAGRLIEHIPARYVDKTDWPAGVRSNTETLTRTWMYQPKAHRFKAGAYRPEP
jgi:hypothetical protein